MVIWRMPAARFERNRGLIRSENARINWFAIANKKGVGCVDSGENKHIKKNYYSNIPNGNKLL